MVKKINLQINLTDKWIYTLVTFAFIIALGVGVYAYQANMQAGNPPTLGHSAGEIHVNNSAGEIVSLQEDLDNIRGDLDNIRGDLFGGELYAKEISLEEFYHTVKTENLGKRKFCALSKTWSVDWKGCSLYNTGGNWYLKAETLGEGGDYDGDEYFYSVTCAAICFN